MSQKPHPYSYKYQAIRLQARREKRRSENQKAQARVWDKGFEIARPDRKESTPLGFATEFGDKRRKVDKILDKKREAADIREVWE